MITGYLLFGIVLTVVCGIVAILFTVAAFDLGGYNTTNERKLAARWALSLWVAALITWLAWPLLLLAGIGYGGFRLASMAKGNFK